MSASSMTGVPMTGTPDLNTLSPAVRDVREHFLEFAEPHRPALWDYCRRLTGSPWDAEDLVQDTLMRAFARLGHFHQPLRDPRAYLFRMATNGWIDALRRARVTLDPLEPWEEPPAGEDSDLRVRSTEALEHLVRHLPPRQRVALLLADAFDFRAGEIGAMLGVSEGAVKALLHRAREGLRSAGGTDPSGISGPLAPLGPEERRVLESFVEAFNRRDPEALVALLEEEATADILGVAEEQGRHVIRAQSLAEAMADHTPQEAVLADFAGEPVILVHYRRPGEAAALGWLIRLTFSGMRIGTWRSYYYTPELLREAGESLGVPAVTAGYRYIPADGGGASLD
jgi:RNA polymerase sigma factor (sigma-70 family)